MSDGRRVPTQGWTFSATGGMSRNDDDVIAIEEVEPDPASAPIASAPEVTAQAQPSRGRRSTLETFNDELAVLERPLEGEVEYFDEKPPSRLPRFVGFVAVILVVGVGGSFLISRHRAAAGTQVVATAPSSPAPAAAQPVLAAHAEAPAATEPAPVEAAAAPAAEEAPSDDEATAGDDSARPAPRSRAEWGKVRNKPGATKHARSSSSKTTKHYRSTTKRTVVKRTLRYH